MKTSRFLAALIFIYACGAVHLWAQTAAPPFRLQTNYITGLSNPLFLTHAGDGTRRKFIVQQRGLIKVVQPNSTTPTDFLNISSVVSSSGNERGLLGLAFHPDYETNRRFFVYYTRQADGAIEIAEYAASQANPNQANPTAVRTIITIPHPTNSNHNGGTIAFGPDGYLYAAPGDGGSANDPPNNAQNINSLLGKVLRIDINTPVGQNPAYNIPPTNPYAGATAGLDEIYAIGMRNPYRFSFDRGGTNQLWVGDVGQNAIEEVDIITLGGNYGWRVYEGTQCTGIDSSLCIPANYIPPVFQYSSSSGARCSVTGGYVYRGRQNALPQGSYLYGDYCSGEILLWHNNQQILLQDTSRAISSFGEDEDGELYVIGLSSGTVDKILGNETSADFDGDIRTDLSVYRPSTGMWYLMSSRNNAMTSQHFGVDGDIPVPEDYDGDSIADIAVFRPSTGTWYYMRSSDATFTAVQHGDSQYVPVPGDYDGDGKADLGLFREIDGLWNILRTANPDPIISFWGQNNDVPVAGDYDGDGRYDIAIWRPSNGTWYVINSANGALTSAVWGEPGDIPARGDFDGDTKIDLTLFRPSGGQWYTRRSSDNNISSVVWGVSTDIPAVGDYDGDGKDDVGVFRPSTGEWWIIGSASGIRQFPLWGQTGDVPLPASDTP